MLVCVPKGGAYARSGVQDLPAVYQPEAIPYTRDIFLLSVSTSHEKTREKHRTPKTLRTARPGQRQPVLLRWVSLYARYSSAKLEQTTVTCKVHKVICGSRHWRVRVHFYMCATRESHFCLAAVSRQAFGEDVSFKLQVCQRHNASRRGRTLLGNAFSEGLETWGCKVLERRKKKGLAYSTPSLGVRSPPSFLCFLLSGAFG